MHKSLLKKSSVILACLLAVSVQAKDYSKVVLEVIPASKNVYMLKGAGGNIGILATEKGLLLVDDQFAPLAERIEKAMTNIVDQPLKYIVNTHHHSDHTGSNLYFSKKAPIYAHENVRKRLIDYINNDADKKDLLPSVTYQNGINIFLANEEIQIKHLPNGHTDGDSIVYFAKANVLHTGDLFFEVGFPYVDLKSGGNVKGYLANVQYMINHFPDDVVIIPGHGKLTNKAGLKAFALMIEESIALVSGKLAKGVPANDIITQGVAERYKHFSWAFISEKDWLETLITDLS